MSIYDEAIAIIDKRTHIGTMSRDYGHHVDDELYVEDSHELTVLDKALESAKKEHELLELYEEKERLQNYHYIVTEKQSSLDKSKINKEFADEMKKYKELLKQIQALKEETK